MTASTTSAITNAAAKPEPQAPPGWAITWELEGSGSHEINGVRTTHVARMCVVLLEKFGMNLRKFVYGCTGRLSSLEQHELSWNSMSFIASSHVAISLRAWPKSACLGSDPADSPCRSMAWWWEGMWTEPILFVASTLLMRSERRARLPCALFHRLVRTCWASAGGWRDRATAGAIAPCVTARRAGTSGRCRRTTWPAGTRRRRRCARAWRSRWSWS